MGIEIDRERFSDEDYRRFARRLEESLDALGQMLARPGFGVGEPTIGAELELFLVDGRGRPLPENTAIRGLVDDPRLTLELDRFNLEVNPSPSCLAGRPFSALERELRSVLEQVGRVAAGCGGRVAMIGILPSLRPGDLRRDSLTDSPRYRALNHSIKRLRREPFRIEIRGTDPEPVRIVRDDLGLEGANTSFQVHLPVAGGDDRAYDGDWTGRLLFARAHANFYEAARRGLDAELEWPGRGRRPRRAAAADLVAELLPAARRGLDRAGVAAEESGPLLEVIGERAASRRTGSWWQRRTVAALEPRMGRWRALELMLERYLELQAGGRPVHTWPVEG